MGAEASAVSATSAGEAGPQVATNGKSVTQTADTASPGNPKAKPVAPAAVVDDDPEIDLGDEFGKMKRSALREQAKRRREYDSAASKRFEEAARTRKEAEAKEAEVQRLADAFKNNPEALFKHFGIDPDQWSEQRLTKSLQRAQLTPEARELEQTRQHNEYLQRQLQERDQREQQERQQAEVQRWVNHYDKELGTALDTIDLPRTEYGVSRVVDVFSQYLEAGEPIPGQLAAEIAHDLMQDDTRQLLGAMLKGRDGKVRAGGAAKLAAFLGDDICRALAEHRVAQHTAAQTPRTPPPTQDGPRLVKQPKQPPTFDEVRKRLGMA